MAEQKDPQQLGLEAGEGGKIIPFPQSGETRDAVSKTLKEAKAEGAKTLKDYWKELEAQKDNPVSAEKLRTLSLVLISLGKYVDVKTDGILLQSLGGDAVGETTTFIKIDPVTLKQDNLSLFKKAMFHEHVHLVKKIDSEPLTELETGRAMGDAAMIYEAKAENVLQVVGLLDEDKNKAILRAVELYSTERYDDLFEAFAEKYNDKYPEKVALNRNAALNIFQLAFPELHVASSGECDIDEDEIRDYEMMS